LQFRTIYIVVTAGLMALTVLSEVSLRGAPPPRALDMLQKVAIALLTVFFSLRLLAFRPGFFSESPAPAPIPAIAEADEPLLAQLAELMDNQKYWRTEGLTIRQLAEKMNVKEYRLRIAINRHLGYRNFNDYLNEYRIREACAVLADPAKRDLTVLEIAYALGYVSLAPFNKTFKETTGMTPTEWRRSKAG
jgi:AraC-like DNA-binding protein